MLNLTFSKPATLYYSVVGVIGWYVELTIIVGDADGSNARADSESAIRRRCGETDSEALFLLIHSV